VLELDIDATIEDIKFRYKKLSLLVHPDKNLGVEDCQIAFDEVKRAYEELCDDAKRDLVIDTIDNTRANVAKERRRLIRKGMKEEDFEETLEVAQAKEVMKAFAGVSTVISSSFCFIVSCAYLSVYQSNHSRC
jgi:DnaJ homolog subfamily C member 8